MKINFVLHTTTTETLILNIFANFFPNPNWPKKQNIKTTDSNMSLEAKVREGKNYSYRFRVAQDLGDGRIEVREYGRNIYTRKANVC